MYIVPSNREDFGLYCLPDIERVREFFTAAGMKILGEYIMDLYVGWKILFAAIAFGLLFSLTYMILLKCFARLLVWLSIVSCLILLTILGFFFFGLYKEETDEDYKVVYQVLAIIFWSINGLIVLLVFCLYSDIQNSLTVIESAASFMFENCGVILVPIVINVFFSMFLLYWIVCAGYLLSTGDISQWGDTPFPNVDFSDSIFRNCFIYHLFAFFWVWAFIISLNQFLISATVVQWYFSGSSDTRGSASIAKSFCWAFFYHIGSLAFGSLLLAIISFIRFIFEYMRKKVMKVQKHNVLARCILACFSCCLKCIGECILFINKNAYVQIIIRSTSFCCAAKEAFRLLIRNATRFALVNVFSTIFIFFGKCAIGVGSAFFSWLVLSSRSEIVDNIYAPSIFIILCFIIGYSIGVFFLTIYDLACTTILQCFLIDEEISGGGANRPKCLDSFSAEIKSSFIYVNRRERLA